MKFACVLILATAVLAPAASAGDSPERRGHGRNNPAVIIEWNELLESTIPVAGPTAPRYYAMMHIAMFDAVNSIERRYTSYHAQVRANHGASSEAAAAQAAHDVLVALIPTAQTTFDAALAARLANIDPWAVKCGTQVGRAIARKILDWRQNDGWSVPATYITSLAPGKWQPTPPALAPAAFAQAADVEPFALITATQFLPKRPPHITSAEYAAAVNEIKTIGAVNSTVRTSEETTLARVWASVGYKTQWMTIWNAATREVVLAKRFSMLDAARAFAMMNAAMHDGLQTAQSSKFVYELWRPITAIQRADEDMNPETAADATWMPLLTTPPYPSYAGNMACIGASAARALALVFETDEVSFTARWTGQPGTADVAMSYGSLWQMALDQARSREVGGIHYPFDSKASQEVCVKVADYTFANYMIPK